MADPTNRMQTKLVMALPVSQPSDVVASKIRYRCRLTAVDAPGA
jgi:hypothetical protein